MRGSNLLFKTIIAAGTKACAALVGFFLTALVSRSLGAEQAGLYLLGFSLLAALAVLFRFGLDNVILRVFGSDFISGSSNCNLARGLVWITLASIPFVILVWVFANPIASLIFNKPEFSPVLGAFIWALPAMALFMLLGFAFQGLHRVIAATVYQNLGLSALFVLTFVGCWWCFPEWINAANASVIYSVCAWLVLISALVLWYRQPKAKFSLPSIWSAEQWSASSNLWVVAIMGLLVQWSGVLVAGAFVESSELAFLSAAQRTAQLTSFVLMVVNMVVAPRYARLWKENNLTEIRRLARLSTRGMIALVLPVVGFMLLFPERVMSVFGDGFEQGTVLLMIMALGQLVNVATGSVGYLLSMSGHERDLRKVTLFSGPLTIVCAVLFTWQWGALGAAWATALGLTAQNLGALWMVKRRLGFWPVG